MTQLNATQGGTEYLANHNPENRVVQAGAEVMFSIGVIGTVSQSGAEFMFRVIPTNNITQCGLEYLYKWSSCTTRNAQIWTITRTDGEQLRFTSLDRDLEWQGETYLACNSLTPSASESIAEVGGVGSIELTGLLASGAVSMFDLHNGKYDNARVEAWLVPWGGTDVIKPLLAGSFGRVEYTEDGFRAEIIGGGGKLTQRPLIRTLQPGCRWQFGDTNCAKDLGALEVTGTIDSGTGARGFVDAARTEPAGYFSRGLVTFTTGDNAGVTAEIKEHLADGVFTLWPRLAFRIDAGDQYTMTPGCTNLLETASGTNGCTAWANVVNYGGFPFVPGRDKVNFTVVPKEGG